MEPGYVIALCLEGAGAIGLVLGLRVRHVETRAKAVELARFLRSGQLADAAPVRIRPAPITRAAPPLRIRTATSSAGTIDPSHALLALRSAYGGSAREGLLR